MTLNLPLFAFGRRCKFSCLFHSLPFIPPPPSLFPFFLLVYTKFRHIFFFVLCEALEKELQVKSNRVNWWKTLTLNPDLTCCCRCQGNMSFINKFIDKAKGSRQQNQPDNHTPQNSNTSSKSISSIATNSTNHSSSHQTDFSSTLKSSTSFSNHQHHTKQDEDLEGKISAYFLCFFLHVSPSLALSLNHYFNC